MKYLAQWQIQDSPEGAPTLLRVDQHMILPNFLQKKLQEIEKFLGCGPSGPHPRSTNSGKGSLMSQLKVEFLG